MKIHNIRRSFATNSSSSHSVVVLDHIEDPDGIIVDDYEFGWENFSCSTPEQKMQYFVAQLYSNFEHTMTEDQLRELVTYTTGIVLHESMRPYVDHQSVWGLSRLRCKPEVLRDFLRDMAKYFCDPHVLFLGGNDNDDSGWSIQGDEPVWLDRMINGYGVGEIRVRRENGVYVMMATNTGDKIRFNFNIDETPSEYTKAITPELVDLKITNYCEADCSFCYQSSSRKGKHVPIEELKSIIDLLYDADVFEVAIGGGEPTTHPNFIELLHYIRDKGIIPNFTTYTTEWLENPALLRAVKDFCGGIGVSVHKLSDLEKVRLIRKELDNNDRHTTVIAQHVVGLLPVNETANLINTCWNEDIHLLLLGYKDIGFGKKYQPFDNSTLPTYMKLMLGKPHYKMHNAIRATRLISIDTAFVNRFQQMLNDLKIDKRTYTSQEGKFSCYIDATLKKMGISSYVDVSSMQNMPKNLEEFKDIFATY